MTNVALNKLETKLEILDKTVDVFSPAFFAIPAMALFMSPAAATPHQEIEDSGILSDRRPVKVIQCPSDTEDEEDDDELMVEEAAERQVSTLSTRSAREGRYRLQEWRQGMIAPRL